MNFLSDGVVGNVFKCMFLGVMVVAKVWKMNCVTIKKVFCIVRIPKRRITKFKYKE